MNNLVLYKLVSGEELVAQELNKTPTAVTIKNAVTLVYQQVGEGKMSVGFAPFMPYGEDEIELNMNTIAASSLPKDQIAQEHTRVFSGIVIASAGTKLV